MCLSVSVCVYARVQYFVPLKPVAVAAHTASTLSSAHVKCSVCLCTQDCVEQRMVLALTNYIVSHKKVRHRVFVITSLNIDRFS